MPFLLDDPGNHFGIIINNQVELQSKTNGYMAKRMELVIIQRDYFILQEILH